jgi:hypothetical protein
MVQAEREPLRVLKTYPAFQSLRAKAETHQLQFRPRESARLKKSGQFESLIDQRTEQAWNALADARKSGLHLNEAEELALPIILVKSEYQEAEERLEQLGEGS